MFVDQKFWAKVDKRGEDECWPWLGTIQSMGYGTVTIARTPLLAHRVACAFDGRQPGSDQVVMHTCDNPPCCNPRHLVVGTQADNVADMHRKGRAVSGYDRAVRGDGHWARRHPEWTYGERNPAAKLTEAEVIEIRSRRQAGASLYRLAREFGVSRPMIGNIVARKNWTHV